MRVNPRVNVQQALSALESKLHDLITADAVTDHGEALTIGEAYEIAREARRSQKAVNRLRVATTYRLPRE